MIKYILPALIVFLIVVFWEKITEIVLKKLEEKRKAKKAKELRIERSKEATLRERKYIYWTDAHTQGRWRSIHSEEYQQKVNKKKPFYY